MVKSLLDLEAGDIVSIYDRDFITDQLFKLGAGPAASVNYRLKDGSAVKWFAVRGSGNVERLVLGDEISLQPAEPAGTITFDGRTFRRVSAVQGRAIGTSAMGFPRYVNMEFFDYTDDDGSYYLFIQKSEDGLVAFYGEPVIAGAVMVFPRPK